jgi:hypothetical protein
VTFKRQVVKSRSLPTAAEKDCPSVQVYTWTAIFLPKVRRWPSR